jgi:hypothetical protein
MVLSYYSSRHQTACFKATEGLHPPLAALLKVNSTALLALLRCEFWGVFTRPGSAFRVSTLYDFVVTLKHTVWWRLLQHGLLANNKGLSRPSHVELQWISGPSLFKARGVSNTIAGSILGWSSTDFNNLGVSWPRTSAARVINTSTY